jgi:hypothetical protein
VSHSRSCCSDYNSGILSSEAITEHKSSRSANLESVLCAQTTVAVNGCSYTSPPPHLQLVVVHVEVLYERCSVQCTTLLGDTTVVMVTAIQQQQDAAVVDADKSTLTTTTVSRHQQNLLYYCTAH